MGDRDRGGSEMALDESGYIRHRMFRGDSLVGRYREIVVGNEVGWLGLLKFEITQLLLGGIPGALGLGLRRIFYPGLFGTVGKGCVFGRHLTLRHPKRIHLGDGVVMDERCVLDGHGSERDGVRIGDRVILNRGCVVQAKIGPIQIGADSDVGADSLVVSQGGTSIGRGVSIGAGSKIGGGAVRLDAPPAEAVDAADQSFAARGQLRLTRGEVRIEDFVVMGRAAMVMDSAWVGRGSVIAAGAIVRSHVPEESVVTLVQKLSVVPRAAFTSDSESPKGGMQSSAGSQERLSSIAPSVVDLLLIRVLEEVNSQSPMDCQLRQEDDAPLMEPDGPLDSMGLINLVVAIEEQVEIDFGRNLQLNELWSMNGVPSTLGELRAQLVEALLP